jgi:hypothetical protein
MLAEQPSWRNLRRCSILLRTAMTSTAHRAAISAQVLDMDRSGHDSGTEA